jgi:hypothetical protein
MTGALLLQFDVAEEARAEHDDWHTHEHMPERLALPGFRRGTRWTALGAGPRYCILYEVDSAATLDSAPYRERLDHPTPWTARMMRSYAGMQRTLCDVVASSGDGIGSAALVVRFAARPGADSDLHAWLSADVVPALAARRGMCSAMLLRQERMAAMSREQSIRGRDASAAAALFATGYDEATVVAVGEELDAAVFGAHGGAEDAHAATAYRLAFALATPQDRAAR